MRSTVPIFEPPARLRSPGYAFLLLRLAMRPRTPNGARNWFVVLDVSERDAHSEA
jgi:hypothetical protein